MGVLFGPCRDILVFARTELALTQMIGECCTVFGKIGLEVALGNKTFWSSSVDGSGRSLVVNGLSPVVSNTRIHWKRF